MNQIFALLAKSEKQNSILRLTETAAAGHIGLVSVLQKIMTIMMSSVLDFAGTISCVLAASRNGRERVLATATARAAPATTTGRAGGAGVSWQQAMQAYTKKVAEQRRDWLRAGSMATATWACALPSSPGQKAHCRRQSRAQKGLLEIDEVYPQSRRAELHDRNEATCEGSGQISAVLMRPEATRAPARTCQHCPSDKGHRIGAVLKGLHRLLQRLNHQVRRTVLETRFTEAQRYDFERWMLSRSVVSCRSPLPRTQLCKQEVQKERRKHRKPSKGSKKASLAALCRLKNGLPHQPGLVVHSRQGREERYYSVVLTVGRIRLLTREHRDLQVVKAFHAALVAFKKRMEGVAQASFEERFRQELSFSLDEHRLNPGAMGLRFCVCLAPLWARPLVTPPFRAEGEALEAGLLAWRRLGEARGWVPRRGSVLQVLSPEDIAASWSRVRRVYLEVLEADGQSLRRESAKRLKAETAIFRLSELEAAQAGLQEKRLERWNQQQMAKEEASQRRHADLSKRLPRTSDEDSEAGRRGRNGRILEDVDKLLYKWIRWSRSPMRNSRILALESRGRNGRPINVSM
ncbi:unnamed protein product [Symbiodinium microadriaticum]|nr:unnamed protein product [Symbiodinium microadriaticum]CAE7898337.1 unnamed protein product [Symbiodinium sp. KB8]